MSGSTSAGGDPSGLDQKRRQRLRANAAPESIDRRLPPSKRQCIHGGQRQDFRSVSLARDQRRDGNTHRVDERQGNGRRRMDGRTTLPRRWRRPTGGDGVQAFGAGGDRTLQGTSIHQRTRQQQPDRQENRRSAKQALCSHGTGDSIAVAGALRSGTVLEQAVSYRPHQSRRNRRRLGTPLSRSRGRSPTPVGVRDLARGQTF
jgi:hypothetical protein